SSFPSALPAVGTRAAAARLPSCACALKLWHLAADRPGSSRSLPAGTEADVEMGAAARAGASGTPRRLGLLVFRPGSGFLLPRSLVLVPAPRGTAMSGIPCRRGR